MKVEVKSLSRIRRKMNKGGQRYKLTVIREVVDMLFTIYYSMDMLFTTQ